MIEKIRLMFLFAEIFLFHLAGATQVGFNRVSGNLLATAHDGLYITHLN